LVSKIHNNFNLKDKSNVLAVLPISIFLHGEICTALYFSISGAESRKWSVISTSTLYNCLYVGLPPSVFKLIKTHNNLKLSHNCTLCSSTKSETFYFLQTCWQLGYLLAPCNTSRSEHSILHQFRQLNDWLVRKIVPIVHLKVNFSWGKKIVMSLKQFWHALGNGSDSLFQVAWGRVRKHYWNCLSTSLHIYVCYRPGPRM